MSKHVYNETSLRDGPQNSDVVIQWLELHIRGQLEAVDRKLAQLSSQVSCCQEGINSLSKSSLNQLASKSEPEVRSRSKEVGIESEPEVPSEHVCILEYL